MMEALQCALRCWQCGSEEEEEEGEEEGKEEKKEEGEIISLPEDHVASDTVSPSIFSTHFQVKLELWTETDFHSSRSTRL
jgi:hypothetical protein